MARWRGRLAAGLWVVASAVGMGALIGSVQWPAGAAEQRLPSRVTFATFPPGAAANAVSSVLASVISRYAPFEVQLAPYSGTGAYVDLVDRGEVDVGWMTHFDQFMAYNGIAPYPRPYKNLRLVMLGAYWKTSALVPRSSSINRIADLRGKRVTGGYNAHPVCRMIAEAVLANGGLTWRDVRVVPVPSSANGVDALMERRVEAVSCALPDMPAVKEADAQMGVRFLPIDTSEAAVSRSREVVPILAPRKIKGGSLTAVPEDMDMFVYQVGIVASVRAPDGVVEEIIKVAWSRQDELANAHPIFAEWDHSAMVNTTAPVPYHPAAIRFYRSQGAWTPELEAHQQALLKQ